MIPFGNKTVTLIHRNISKGADGKSVVSYTVSRLQGCSWKFTKSAKHDDGAFIDHPSMICRIPVGQKVPDVGDILMLGVYNKPIADSAAFTAVLENENAMKVESIGDNSLNGVLPHYVCKG